ncbi:MAG: hypothetical protein R3F48_16815 [Candidatus Zixiibacteriota bacterium]
MEHINLIAGWTSILAGFIAGAAIGLFFYKENWLGGYSDWQRRMTRLGHISFFGIGIINVAYALSAPRIVTAPFESIISTLLLIGLVSMPLVCFLSAYKMFFRHLFPIPVISLIVGIGLFIYKGL